MEGDIPVVVFIDGSNVFWGLKYYNANNKTEHKLDFNKLVKHLVDRRYLVRPYFYCSVKPEDSSGKHKFIDSLQFNGFQVVTKLLKTRPDGTGGFKTIEKGVDAALVTDLLSLAWEDAYKVAIVVSGDGDFLGAIEKVKSKGKRVEIVSFRENFSGDLKRVADKLTYLNDIMPVIKR